MWKETNKVKPKNDIFTTQARTKDSEKSPLKLSEISLKYLKLYCEYSSLNSLKYLADTQRPWFERVLWVIIHFLVISTLVFMVYLSYQEFILTPLVTSMETDSYRTTNLNMPGIAICSINRISRQSATELATNIFNAKVTDQSVDEILDLLTHLGDLYASTFVMDASLNVELHKLLTTYFNGSYDITDTMKELTPQCSMMLLKCKLHGVYRNCSELFTFRKTQDGYCCTFNYARESDDIPVMNGTLESLYIHQIADLGIERGLTVVMDPLLDDYFSSILPIKGWKVIVFNPTDYPDMTTGGVTEIFATPLSETFVDITTTAFISTEIVHSFSRQKRNCIFSDEDSPMYSDTMYTYSDCIVDCKVYNIQKVCGCRPFFYPRRSKSDWSWRVCNSEDLNCLAKYKSKWLTIFPYDDEGNIFRLEKNALHCRNCYPACNDVSYDVFTWKSNMSPGGYNTNLLWNYNVTDEGVLHVYFSKYGTIRLKQDVAFYWYELMSDIGGICGVFIGFSFISIVEILYFVALVFRDFLCKTSSLKEDNNHKDEIPSVQSQITQEIYWKELFPRSWRSAKYGKVSNNRARY
ncbi:PREDICTED: sodium channel protein Nach-like [Vollenhovia emeryi]|uniref:sodium channel protein Nach-like n=1 Tax=Vollenhovia emeryi TaxID=411798 RepID=UPI0005F47E67|nr:PREDICTED: sodium channel protein Nach-like [Vollenhovia emeryi]